MFVVKGWLNFCIQMFLEIVPCITPKAFPTCIFALLQMKKGEIDWYFARYFESQVSDFQRLTIIWLVYHSC